MKKLALPLILAALTAGCAQQSRYALKPGDAARISADRHIQAVMDATYAAYGNDEELDFSSIYSIRSVRGRNDVSWQVCALFRGSDWEPGEYKQTHLHRGIATITDANVLTGVCDLARYPSRPSNFTFMSGDQVDKTEIKNSNNFSDTASQEEYRTRITPSSADIEFAQNVVLEVLRDPESARFRGIYGNELAQDKVAVCGEVNAKNAFGGYTGYSPFMVVTGTERAYMWSSRSGSNFDNTMIETMCLGE